MYMIGQDDQAQRFLAMHRPGQPLLMPNPWDLGSAKLLASLGFEALATTSWASRPWREKEEEEEEEEEEEDSRRGDRGGDRPAGLGGPGERLRGRSGRSGRDHAAGDRGWSGASVEDFAPEPGNRIYDVGLATRTPSRRPPRRPTRASQASAHRPGGELPARPPRPGRHHRQAAGLPGGRSRASCTRRACAVSRTSANWSARWTGPSTCWPWTPPVAQPHKQGWSRSP